MQGTHTCDNCGKPIYEGRYANDKRWYHASTLSTDCDHPVDRAAPKPEPIFTEEMIGESIARHDAIHDEESKRLAGLEVLINTVEARLESLETDVERVEEKADYPKVVMAVDPALKPIDDLLARIAKLELTLKAGYGIPPTVPSGDDMRMFPKIKNLLVGKPMFRHFCTTHNRDFEICLYDVEVDDRYCNVGSTAKPYTWADDMKPRS